jgi:hypothetical protein
VEVVLYVAGALAALGAGAGALTQWVIRPVLRLTREVREFLQDWRGDPGRPGVPPRPGVMSRLERIEWHVGNGDPTPLRRVVERLEDEVKGLTEDR